MLSEADIESLVYKQFIKQATTNFVNFVELGAAHGFQSMKFLICFEKLRTLSTIDQAYYVLVEAYPPHFPHLLENWANRNCKIILGAVSEQRGRARFLTQWNGCSGENFWAGVLTSVGDLEVETYTLYEIMEIARIGYISFLHMDIQGEEENIVQHCAELVVMGKLNSIYIGTHGNKRHELVKQTLTPHIPIILEAAPNSVSITPFGSVLTTDGILFFSNSVDLFRTNEYPAHVLD